MRLIIGFIDFTVLFRVSWKISDKFVKNKCIVMAKLLFGVTRLIVLKLSQPL